MVGASTVTEPEDWKIEKSWGDPVWQQQRVYYCSGKNSIMSGESILRCSSKQSCKIRKVIWTAKKINLKPTQKLKNEKEKNKI